MSSLTTVTFENSTISEAVKRLVRVAPTKGEAFDKAAGIVIEVTPGETWPVIMKATNLSLYYLEWVGATSSAGDPVTWRVSSEVFSQIITKLPIGSGKTVEFTEQDNKLHIKSGRFKAAIGLIKAGYYPDWKPFDPAQTSPVSELGARIDQVSWAAVKRAGGEAISGIRFNGETLAATDKYRLANVPCAVSQVTKEVVINPGILSSLINVTGETKVGIVGDQMILSPNDYTQIRCITYGSEFPPVERVMQRDHTDVITVNRNAFIEAISRVTAADAKNRMPQMSMYIGKEEVAVYVAEETGTDMSIDSLDTAGQALHDRLQIFVSPQNLMDAINASPSDTVNIHYDQKNNMKFLRIEGSAGYEAWIVPKTGVKVEPVGEQE